MRKDFLLFVLALLVMLGIGIYYFYFFSSKEDQSSTLWTPPTQNPPTTQIGVSIQESQANSTP